VGAATGRIPAEQNKPELPNDALLFDLLAVWAPRERGTASWSRTP
jgi:hypothetical protein